MNITICDDDTADLLRMEALLLKYKKLHPDIGFDLEKFHDPDRLYQRISEGNLSDIYILDMLMPKRSGIDLGNQIRASGCENIIIYVTSSDDYALDAYAVHAVRYLLKPVHEDKLFEALDYSLSYIRTQTDPIYLVKTQDGLVQAPYSKIEYIENARRKLEIHLTNGEVIKSLFIRKSFEEEICRISEHRNFQQVHKSFLVNLNYVRCLSADSVTMESGKQLPISKAKSAKVKREYLLFVSGKN